MAEPIEGSAAARGNLGPIPGEAKTESIPVVTPAGDAGTPTDSGAEPESRRGRHAASGDEPKKGGTWRAIREFGLIVVIALLLSVLVRAFLVQAFYVPSSSMMDTLQIQDRILASKITTRFEGVQRGEVVVFKDPGGWLPDPPAAPGGWRGLLRSGLTFVGLLPSDSGHDLVKRVIAVGGDHIACCDAAGHIMLNGQPLIEPYIKPGGGTDQVVFDVTVPQGMVFVMGDNRGDSRDSRYHLDDNNGGVPVDDVVGRVVLILWPANRFGTVPIPSTFDNVPAA